MATLASKSPSPSPPFTRKRKSLFRRCERVCCSALSLFPLAFVYGLTTWAVWVEVKLGMKEGTGLMGMITSIFGVILYLLGDASYTVAVFTDPGSPLNPYSASPTRWTDYSSLPSQEPDQPPVPNYTSLTAKSSGRPRFCKKCQSVKPDRAHHCSTCHRCVLKMDHHCPWLATCVGLRNYKPFLLFLTYISLFCWLCFFSSAQWVWTEIAEETNLEEGAMIVNTILLAVLGGIIGLVLSGFTGWHIYLAISGQTTIESLEKTRYLSPLKKSMEAQLQRGKHYVGQGNVNDEEHASYADQLKEIHANALPGVTRPEEGEERESTSSSPLPSSAFNSPARDSLRHNYANMEEQRERDRYTAYLDEQDSEKMPHAFDRGWRTNLAHVFGNNPWLWALPVCNTSGDGWRWDVSEKWTAARDELARERLRSRPSHAQYEPLSGAGRHYVASEAPSKTSTNAHARPNGAGPAQSVAMQAIDRRKHSGYEDGDEYDTSSDEDSRRIAHARRAETDGGMENWNDIPDDYLSVRKSGARSRSRARPKGD